MGLSLGAAPHRLLLVVVLLGAPAGPADGFVWSSASRNQTLARAEEVVPLRAASQGPAVATREASPSNPVSLPLPADAASLPRGKGFDTFEEVQGRCFGAPYPLVFGKRVSLPEVEINEEIRAKKQAIGFFGSSVKNPGGKNEGTTADRVLKNLLKERGMRGGSRGSAKPRNLLGQHAAAEDPEDAKDEVGQPLGGRRSGAGVPGTGEMLRGGGGRRQLAGKADSLPLVRFCAKERAAKHLRPGEEAIEQCILKPHTCADWKTAQRAVRGLDGIKQLNKNLTCITVNRSCRRAYGMTRAVETGAQITSSQQSVVIRSSPMEDIPRRYRTCAVVGNGPGLKMGGHKLGSIIDKHDAVIKYNLKSTGSRPGKQVDGEEAYHGARSDFRIMNKKRSESPLSNDWWGGLRPSDDPEHWIYWNYGTAIYFRGITRINPRSFFISPDFQMWLVNSYFALRGEMYRIGMASNSRPLQCPVNISSGIHGVWLAFQMCETVNLYGFSWNLNMLSDRTDGPSVRVSGSHSWDFDTMVLKLLALAGKVNICTS